MVNRITEYTSIGTIYTQALEQLLAKGKITLPEIKERMNPSGHTLIQTITANTIGHKDTILKIVGLSKQDGEDA